MKAVIRDNNPVVVLEKELPFLRREEWKEGGRAGVKIKSTRRAFHPKLTFYLSPSHNIFFHSRLTTGCLLPLLRRGPEGRLRAAHRQGQGV